MSFSSCLLRDWVLLHLSFKVPFIPRRAIPSSWNQHKTLFALQSSKPMQFTANLPPPLIADVVPHILKYCDAKTLSRASIVCRAWNLMANSNELWADLCKEVFGVAPFELKPRESLHMRFVCVQFLIYVSIRYGSSHIYLNNIYSAPDPTKELFKMSHMTLREMLTLRSTSAAQGFSENRFNNNMITCPFVGE